MEKVNIQYNRYRKKKKREQARHAPCGRGFNVVEGISLDEDKTSTEWVIKNRIVFLDVTIKLNKIRERS